MKDVSYNEVINRIGYFRTKANLSVREASFRIGKNETFLHTIENQSIQLKVQTLLEFCDAIDISIFDFFYLGDKYDPKHKEVLELFRNLNDEHKNLIIDLMKALKK